MPKLHVSDRFSRAIPGLGRNRPFSDLCEKRVTKCVRDVLQAENGQVVVS
jgi:hypothetical protein